METTKYELKYCERCGTLKLRPVESGTTYCRRCERLLARFAFPRGASATHSSELSSSAAVEKLAGIPLTDYSDGLSRRVH
jgi:ribosomal protein L37AE/L43A